MTIRQTYKLIVPIVLLLVTIATTVQAGIEQQLQEAEALADSGQWEQALQLAQTVWQQPECAEDSELKLSALLVLARCNEQIGKWQQAIFFQEQVLALAASETGYEYEHIYALVDLANNYSRIADLTHTAHFAQLALDAAHAFVTTNMPRWAREGDIEAITQAAGLSEDVLMAVNNAIEDCYIAAEDKDRQRLAAAWDPLKQAQQLREMWQTMSKAPRQTALTIETAAMYKRMLCSTLLLAQRMANAEKGYGKAYVDEVLAITDTTEAYHTIALARQAAIAVVQDDLTAAQEHLKRLRSNDIHGSYRDVITENEAWIAVLQDRWEEALPLLQKRLDTKIRKIQADFYWMTSEARQQTWLAEHLWYFKQNIDLCTTVPHPDEVNAFIYDNILAHKGILLSAETELLQLAREMGQEEVVDSIYSLRQLHCHTLTNDYRQRLLEQFILDNSHAAGDFTEIFTITSAKVAAALTDRQVAIEFFETDNSQMYALVLRHGWATPRLVRIGENRQLVKLQRNRRQILKPANTQQVWQEILTTADIHPGEHIYFAPDGLFYLTPIEYMMVDSTHTMSDIYCMHRVSSTRELCRRQSKDRQQQDVVLYGGVCYATADSGQSAQSTIPYLQGTLQEVNMIDSILPQAEMRVCDAATETSFKQLSAKAPQIIHIATHGFYLTDNNPTHSSHRQSTDSSSTTRRDALLMSRLIPEARINVEDFAMARAGLLFAGAEHNWGEQTYHPANDGVLTAQEIAMLHLDATQIVVLSACKTALGQLTVDGVAGLQRGFKKAGVSAIMMSLWQVDDKATQLFMTEFYRRLAEGETPTTSLQQAQLFLREWTDDSVAPTRPTQRKRPYLRAQTKLDDDDDKHPYAAPYYWAAFVLLDAI